MSTATSLVLPCPTGHRDLLRQVRDIPSLVCSPWPPARVLKFSTVFPWRRPPCPAVCSSACDSRAPALPTEAPGLRVGSASPTPSSPKHHHSQVSWVSHHPQPPPPLPHHLLCQAHCHPALCRCGGCPRERGTSATHIPPSPHTTRQAERGSGPVLVDGRHGWVPAAQGPGT